MTGVPVHSIFMWGDGHESYCVGICFIDVNEIPALALEIGLNFTQSFKNLETSDKIEVLRPYILRR